MTSSSAVNWAYKAIRRKTTGTGRLRHLKQVHQRFKHGFREGGVPKRKGVKQQSTTAAEAKK